MESKNEMPLSSGFSRREFLAGAATMAFPFAAEGASVVKPEDKIKYEKFIIEEVDKIKTIIANKAYGDILSSPYLIYCLYYMPSFLDQVSKSKNRHHVSEKIIGSVAHLITPEFRAQAILSLEEQTKEKERQGNKKISTNESLPMKNFIFGKKGENHNNAVDLFAKESTPVCSMGGGLVLVADSNWQSDNELSSSSVKGGNTVIIFNYLTKEFYRYVHLNKVAVCSGELVLEGQDLGTVGHTGNASRPGHGKHLHFEIHKYLSDKNTVQALWDDDLRGRLKKVLF